MKSLITVLLCLYASFTYAQAPASPRVLVAVQEVASINTAATTLRYYLKVSGNISPRVLRPGSGQPTEKITVTYIGNWLDITNNVLVSGTGVEYRGVTARANGELTYSDETGRKVYRGPYITVEYTINSSAAAGTRTVRLQRPGLPGANESVFYLEVLDVVRITKVEFKKNEETVYAARGRVNQAGVLRISGQNLNRLNGMRAGGKLREVGTILSSSTQLFMSVTLNQVTEGYGYYDILAYANVSGLSTADYPVIAYSKECIELEIERSEQELTRTCVLLSDAVPGGIIYGPSAGNTPVPDIQIELMRAFQSGAELRAEDIREFNLGQGMQPGTVVNVDIPPLKIRIRNVGGAATAGNLNLYICTKENSNYTPRSLVSVPVLGQNGSYEYELPRMNSTIRIRKMASGTLQREITAATPLWNDLNVLFSCYNGLRAVNFRVGL